MLNPCTFLLTFTNLNQNFSQCTSLWANSTLKDIHLKTKYQSHSRGEYKQHQLMGAKTSKVKMQLMSSKRFQEPLPIGRCSEMRYLQQLLYLECETSKSVTLNPSHFHHFMLLHDKIHLPNNIFEDVLHTFHQRTQHFCKQIDEMSM